MNLKRTIFSLVLLSFATQALAQPTWYFQNVMFDDGGIVSGYFTYDASTNTYSNIHIVTSAGSTFGGATYSIVDAGVPHLSGFLDSVTTTGNLVGTPAFQVIVRGDLTNAGGTVSIFGGEFTCSNPGCSTATRVRSYSSGELTTTPVLLTSSWFYWYVL